MLVRRESNRSRENYPGTAHPACRISTTSPSGERYPHTVPTRSRGELEYVPHCRDAYFIDSLLLDSKIVRLEKTTRELHQERDDLNETINSLRADLRTRDNSSSALRIQLADAQRRADGFNHTLEQMHQFEFLYSQGRIQGAAECLLEAANTVDDDVRTNKLIMDWLSSELRRRALR